MVSDRHGRVARGSGNASPPVQEEGRRFIRRRGAWPVRGIATTRRQFDHDAFHTPSVRIPLIVRLGSAAFAVSMAGAPALVAQGVAGVLAGGAAIVGTPCSETDVPITGPDVTRRASQAVAPPVDSTAGDTVTRAPATTGTAAQRPLSIALIASAEAREIRFARQPRVRVRLCGGLDSVRVVERRNLPRPVVAGQAYRDVYIAVEILGRVNAECVAERLGVRDASGVTVGACASLTMDTGAMAHPAMPDSTPPPGGRSR